MRASILRRSAMTLIEMMISLALIAVLGTGVTMLMEGSAGWNANASTEDALAEDVLTVWKTLNDDISQSAWYIPDTNQGFGTPSFSVDRDLAYAPFVYQPAITGAGSDGVPTDPLLSLFGRTAAADVRFEGSGVYDLDHHTGVLPGTPADRNLAPSAMTAAAYQTSYFARSQELVFVRATTTIWNRVSNRPVSTTGTQAPQVPLEQFPGSTAAWQAAGNHGTVQTLRPSGWQRDTSGNGWTAVTPGTPYGRVMDACFLYTGGGVLNLQLQLEQNRQPDFQQQQASDVRWFSYAVVPSPRGMGLGRLVRTVRKTGTAPTRGSDPGNCIASAGGDYLAVDRVISDNVVRVLFDTARHANDLGITNVRATIFFARLPEKNRATAAPLHRAVTMVFTMRAANSWQEKDTVRSLIKTSTAIASGAIPFTY